MSPKKMKKAEPSSEQEQEVMEEIKKTASKVDQTPLKELPEEELLPEDKLFEIKKSNDRNTEKILRGLAHLEKKIDYVYGFLSKRFGQR